MTGSANSRPQENSRFHSMDGVRASMMLLGIFFHVAWFFYPKYAGHPISDQSANWGITYFFFWTHTFRMQAFFLIAGFFAALLIEKRGVSRFLSNRTMRVVLPFALSMILLYPLMRYQMILGGLKSGRIQSGEPAWQLLITEFLSQDWWQVWPIHLWFLYCLMIVYVISLAILLVFRFIIDRGGSIRRFLQTAFAKVIGSCLGLPLLTLPIAGLLFWAELSAPFTWFGIDTGPFDPIWTGVFAYWVFFAVGWCLYKQPNLLRRFNHGWHWRISLGTIISILLCAHINNMVINGRIGWLYPLLSDAEIRNYAQLREQLLEAESESDKTPRRFVWSNLSPEYQRFVRQTTSPTSDQLAGLALEINLTSLTSPELNDPKLCANLSLETPWQAELSRTADPRTGEPNVELNRKIVESAFAPAIASRWYAPLWQRVTYFFAYALTSWLLVFGTIGFFNRFLTRPSPRFRYLADSSYWLYLIHLPVQFQIQVWIAPVEMNAWLKFSIYIVFSFAIMLPTYHYLVRSTWIGLLLNGRRYEFVPWLRRTRSKRLALSPNAGG